ncbi:hypothetical protein EJ063_03925 [Vibrio aquaticus]|uniref:Lipoprotein n=1 Tax=Vibrio aquaticus TaxID=2496559 RepID=A0A432D258_9VIBR|nr:hypothetical protein [Vibrio aquaticus]RTZ17945.1 hypothetical protein EJ063_03925 [Vibrio aquaticus]
MKLITSVTLLSAAILAGCQSTSSPEEQAIRSNLCTAGDGSGSSYTQEMFEKAVMGCGGYEIFVDDMLIGQELVFSFNNGKKKRQMVLMDDGTGKYTKLESGASENITWELQDNGNLHLAFEDGYKWDWRLIEEKGAFWGVKSHGYGENEGDRDVLSMVVMNQTALTSFE